LAAPLEQPSKLKPFTVPICVISDYKILGVSVSKIRAKGHLDKFFCLDVGVFCHSRVKTQSFQDFLEREIEISVVLEKPDWT